MPEPAQLCALVFYALVFVSALTQRRWREDDSVASNGVEEQDE